MCWLGYWTVIFELPEIFSLQSALHSMKQHECGKWTSQTPVQLLMFHSWRKSICNHADVLLLEPCCGQEGLSVSWKFPRWTPWWSFHPPCFRKSTPILLGNWLLLKLNLCSAGEPDSATYSRGDYLTQFWWIRAVQGRSQMYKQKQVCFIGPSSCFFWDHSVTSRLALPALL